MTTNYCVAVNCPKIAYFGYDDIEFCEDHKEDDMKYLHKSNKCIFEDCDKRSSFGFEGERPRFCVQHKQPNMIDVIHKKCSYKDCTTRPTFGLEGEKPKFCIKHKEPNMQDVVSKKCLHKGCKTQPTFGLEGEKPKFCGEHKEQDMQNCTIKKCLYNDCKKQPTFGLEGEKPKFCSEHKKQNMQDIKHKKCVHDGCKKRSTFGLEGEKPKFCSEHKEQDMQDLENKKCLYKGCNKSASFALEGERPKFCSDHKNDAMVKYQRCFFKGCQKRPHFGLENGKAKFCSEHKDNDMEDVTRKKCASNLPPYNIPCDITANKNYKDFCTKCFAHLFPDDPLTSQIRCKTKEITVINFISKLFNGFIHDKPLFYGCDCPSRRRIDLRKLIGNTILAIEIDEHQHNGYDSKSEHDRYDDLYCQFSGKFIFIRFNPDKYKKKGKTYNPTNKTRFEILKKEVEKQISIIENDMNTDPLTIIHLYYDEN